MIEVLDIGDRVETGTYRLHSRFHGALAFVRNGSASLVSVVDETKGPGPVHIVVRGLDFSHTDFLAVAPHTVLLGCAAIPVEQRSDSRLRPVALNRTRLKRNLGSLEETLRACAPVRSVVFLFEESPAPIPASAFEREFANRFRGGVERLVSGDFEGAAAIRGLGPGLTPSGDDFLAGFLLGLYALEAAGRASLAPERRAIGEMARSRNPFSAALLNCAAEGRCIEPARALIHSLFEDSEPTVIRHARRLAAVGASSGADLATGVYFALKSRQGANGRQGART
jgi:hypothetical protein